MAPVHYHYYYYYHYCYCHQLLLALAVAAGIAVTYKGCQKDGENRDLSQDYKLKNNSIEACAINCYRLGNG